MAFAVYAPADAPVLQLGADELISYGRGAFLRGSSPETADIVLVSERSSKFDDAFSLESADGKLYVRGANDRSVLYGIFEYLRRAGFDFLYPGREGEIVPEKPEFTLSGFDVREKASRRFRGIAAAPDPENLQEGYDLIRFMVQNRYNLFFMEGFDVERPGDEYSIVDGVHPYQHVEYLLRGKSWEERREIALKKQTMVEYARRYGLLIERGGHGWNYGVPEHYGARHGLTPAASRELLRAKGKVNKQAVAPVSTWFQLCLSNEEVREIYAEHIVDYLRKHHGEMDIAAIWLGDGYDNKCQCEACLQVPFSDWYMDIFRRAALRVREECPELTLECIMYFETLEPPTRNYLEGLDNVIMNLAVWRHCYFHALDDEKCRLPGWVPDYRHNASHDDEHDMRIIDFDHYTACAAWRKVVGEKIPCLLFNYITHIGHPDRHFMSYDLTHLCRYFADFDRLNFSGMTDCQCHSSWDKPANLQLYGAGRMLWNKEDADPQKIRQELFSKLFGAKRAQVTQYCDEMHELLISCGDYHHSLEFTPEKTHTLKAGLAEMGRKLEALGPLPEHRERYFRDSLAELRRYVDEALEKIRP
ncbi:MAG: DUF4838 domain-containing protein [Lentisphaeria bacterium]|nr:DUF4838 domain-containing protein [Lentisphaeria bacterium]